MSPFLQELLGKGNDLSTLAAAFVFALIGIFITLLLGSTQRQVLSESSPIHFSWHYLFSDNFKRIVATLLMVVVSLRFVHDLFGFELSSWHGFIIGSGWDGLAFIIKQKTKLLDPKQ